MRPRLTFSLLLVFLLRYASFANEESRSERPSSPPRPVGIDAHILAASLRYGVHPELVSAVIQAESAYDRWAISPRGARGLMQLMPVTSRMLGVTDPFDPVENITGGVRYLRGLMDLFGGNATLAVAAYNAGPEAVMRYRGVPPYAETRAYLRRIRGVLSRKGKSDATR